MGMFLVFSLALVSLLGYTVQAQADVQSGSRKIFIISMHFSYNHNGREIPDQSETIDDSEETPLKLPGNVTVKPSVEIKSANFHMINEPSTVECLVDAYPEPTIYWFYKDCQDDSCDFQPHPPLRTETGMFFKSYLNVTANQSGFVKCIANNSLGMDQSVVEFIVTDVSDGFGIWGLDKDTIEKVNGTSQFVIAVGDPITLYCAASRYKYDNQLTWFKTSNGHSISALEENDHYSITTNCTKFSNLITLSIRTASYEDSGHYTCQATKSSMPNSYQFLLKNVTVSVRDLESPIITETNLNDTEYSINYPYRFALWCYARGVPRPTITWYKDGEEVLETTTKERITLHEGNRKLILERTEPEDEGSYVCIASNKVGIVQRQMELLITNKPEFNYNYVLIVLTVILLFMILSVLYVYLRFRKERELRRQQQRKIFLKRRLIAKPNYYHTQRNENFLEKNEEPI